MAVVGAGFIGAEVAATCRGRGIDVSLIEALPVPLERGLGPEMGAVVADVHRDHGVDVRLGVGVVLIEGGDRVERIRLTDGAVLDIDLVVIGIGVAPEHRLARGLGPHDRQRRGVRRHLHRGARAWWRPATWPAGRTGASTR